VTQEEGVILAVFHPNRLNGVFEYIFAFNLQNISLEMSVCWLSEDVVSFKIEVGM